jgi:ABC-type lipoprotein release transport system permease subunit
LVLKEIWYRKLNSALALLSVALAVACLVGAVTLLRVHDLCTQQILDAKQSETRDHMAQLDDAMRRAMLGLGFNIVILSQDQKLEEWYAEDSASHDMPEEYAQRLAASKLVTIQHLLPCLQQRVRWPEQKRTIILVGTRGEVAGSHKPMLPRVPAGKIVLGNELHETLRLAVGDKLELMGRPFSVHQCLPMRGNKDDITAWIDLKEAQQLLGKSGRINAILALECQCAFADLPKVRGEITRLLPETQVIERGSEALARAEARRKVADEAQDTLRREQAGRAELRAGRAGLASILVPLVMLASAVWVALLALGNVRDRRGEIGILRAVGVGGRQIMLLFLSKAVLTGLAGGAMGCLAGYLLGLRLGEGLEGTAADGLAGAAVLKPVYAALAVAVAPLLAAIASWLPAMLASRQDPAVILREE